jgi:hypothetical protein
MNVYIVIPYYQYEGEVKTNDVKVFSTRQAADEYVMKERFEHYDIISETLN